MNKLNKYWQIKGLSWMINYQEKGQRCSWIGKYTKRVKHSKKVVNDVKNKYGEGPQAIGHSLGGYLAENSGAKNVVTYNKLALPFQSKNPFQTDIRTSNDMASVFSNRKNKNITLKSKSWNPFVAHSTKSLKNKNAIKK